MVSLKYFQIYRNVKICYASRNHCRIAKSLIFTRLCILYTFKLHHIFFYFFTNISLMLCYICKSRVNPTAKCIECSVCKNFCHKLCIPGVHKYDDFYANIENANDWICSQCNKLLFPYNHIDDDGDFIQCLSENWRVTIGTIINELQENVFNPFEVNSEKKQSANV